MPEEKKSSIGAIWKGQTQAGDIKLTIKLDEPMEDGVYYTALVNNYKEDEKHPDFKIMRPREMDSQSSKPQKDTIKDDIPF
tara:strand:+ start:436 stop:678 length:243 start_codon:yes stop_codon:yes gene_type:complete